MRESRNLGTILLPIPVDGQREGTRKVVNGPSRQMMAERERGEEEGIPFCSSSPTPLATAPLLTSGCCTGGNKLTFGDFPNTILCILSQ